MAHPVERPPSRAALLEQLVADVRPVRRLWSPGRRLGAWLGLQVLVLVGLAASGLRPDLARLVHDAAFLAEVLLLAGAAALVARMALRLAVPGHGAGRLDGVLAGGLAALGTGLWLRIPAVTDVAVGSFLDAGTTCLARTGLLAAAPLASLLVAIRRGAPLATGRVGALAGLAAFLMAVALLRLVCPTEDPIHLAAWHLGPVGLGTALTALVGLRLLGRWRRP